MKHKTAISKISIIMRKQLFFMLLALIIGSATAKAAANEYTVTASLPKTEIQPSDKAQNISIDMANVVNALEAVEEGLYDKVFPAYTTVYLFNEDGKESALGLTCYTSAQKTLNVRIPANTTFPEQTLYLGKLNIETSAHEDLRVTSGYSFSLTISAGSSMPEITLTKSNEEQTVDVELDGFMAVTGELFTEVFIDNSNFVLLHENGDLVDGVSLYYTEADGLKLTVNANTEVAKNKYYLAADFGKGEYTDFRLYGIELYITLAVENPRLDEYDADDIVVDEYSIFTPVMIEGYAAKLKAMMGDSYFNEVFKTPGTYVFIDPETSNMLNGITLNYNKIDQTKAEFSLIVSEAIENIENKNVYLAEYDWNTESSLDLGVKIKLNLTVKGRAMSMVEGTLPDTHLKYSDEEQTVDISTESLEKKWYYENPSYILEVFKDGKPYMFISENGEYIPEIEMIYSSEKQVLTAKVYAGIEVPEGDYYLLNAETMQDFREIGYSVKIRLSVSKASSVRKETEPCRLTVTENGISIEAYSTEISIYNITGEIKTQQYINGKTEIALDKGLYIVSANGKAQKIVVR